MRRPGYASHLVSSWIPALTGIEARLRAGGSVADVGCGRGSSTILMAQAFPDAVFVGIDSHGPSIEHARQAADKAGVADHVEFRGIDATKDWGEGYDLITFFDCLHDMGDPVGALRAAHHALAPGGGSVMLVEPPAADDVMGNINPVAKAFAAISTLCCVPNSLAAEGPALGALVSEPTLRDTARRAGFRTFRRTADAPFNRVFEAKT
ncbi:class I SAM-dependent methyltransferase [Streptomyces sp. BA2]|uniref:class I SAM-dependent methyltransferase n=1 Tax=Streptomyces sp. BA2 TaxID=436595 RepID=UPI0019212D81|nr:class I SAM-dependent methyltransferase [Streptomyces sp. BA2]